MEKKPFIFAGKETFHQYGEDKNKSLIVGRFVANSEFMRAMLKYAPIDEYHFFLANLKEMQKFSDVYQDIFQDQQLKKRIKLVPTSQFAKAMAEVDYSVMHLSDIYTDYADLTFMRNRYAAHMFPITAVTHTLSNWLPGPLLKLICGGPRPFDSVVCTSNAAVSFVDKIFKLYSEQLAEHSGGNFSFQGQLNRIPLGVDQDRFCPGDRQKARQNLGLSKDGIIILSLSRFTYYTKMDIFPLVCLLAQLKKDLGDKIDFTLLLAGSVQHRQYPDAIKKYAARFSVENNIKFLIDFEEEKKPDIYRAADIFVSPSDNLQETFGLTVIEAMASGLPVVASDFNGYKDTVKEGVNGFLIPTFWTASDCDHSESIYYRGENYLHLLFAQNTALDLEVFQQRLKTLILNTQLRQDMGQQGRDRVEQKYAWPRVIEQYFELWQRLKSEAANYQRPEIDAGAPISPYYYHYPHLFSHYPTRELADQDRFTQTSFGGDFLKNRRKPWVLGDLEEHIDLELLRQIIFYCRRTVTLGQLVERVGKNGVVPRAKISFHLTWALKHGLVRIG